MTLFTGIVALGANGVQSPAIAAEMKPPAAPVVKPPVVAPVKKPAPISQINNCKKVESMYLSLETKSYTINICGGDKPHDMVLLKKSDRTLSRLPLEQAEPTMFKATLKDNLYLLTKGTPKGDIFTITKVVYQESLREPITKGWSK